MATALAPNAGMSAAPNVATPNSEKSIYYDAGPDTGGDVMRKPSVATGALEQREPASKHDGGNTNTHTRWNDDTKDAGDVKDRGYGRGHVPVPNEKQNNMSAPQNQQTQYQQHEQEPTPAYAEQGNDYFPRDYKAPVQNNEAGGSSRQAQSQQPHTQQARNQAYSMPQPQPAPASQATDHAEDKAHPQRSPTSSDQDNQVSKGAFGKGAALTGPDAIPDDIDAQHQRIGTAESNISEGAKNKITKAELKDGKRLMKVIKSEGAAQKNNLNAFVKELSKLQKTQKKASKGESKALSAHNKATARAHEAHTKFLAAKAAQEKADADLRAQNDALESARVHAQNMTAELTAKSRQAEELRRAKMVDDREREARLVELSQTGKKQD